LAYIKPAGAFVRRGVRWDRAKAEKGAYEALARLKRRVLVAATRLALANEPLCLLELREIGSVIARNYENFARAIAPQLHRALDHRVKKWGLAINDRRPLQTRPLGR
jgi:hypothetical protein